MTKYKDEDGREFDTVEARDLGLIVSSYGWERENWRWHESRLFLFEGEHERRTFLLAGEGGPLSRWGRHSPKEMAGAEVLTSERARGYLEEKAATCMTLVSPDDRVAAKALLAELFPATDAANAYPARFSGGEVG